MHLNFQNLRQKKTVENSKNLTNLTHPIGDVPILLTKISFRDFETNQPLLLLEPENGEGIVFGYDSSFLNTLLQLLSKAMEKSEWGFDSEFITQIPERTAMLQ